MFLIGTREISHKFPPYLIAEISGNHNQSLDRALKIVDAAAANGANAVKLQTYTANTMTLNVNASGFVINDLNSLWHGRQLYELYQEAHTPWEWHKPIIDRASSYGMHCFSTPFDETAVDFLESLEVPAYKIASFEITDLQLIRKVASTGKPIIMSTGMATIAEVDEAVRSAREFGCQNVMLLKCTSTYPASPKNSNVSTIPHMRTLFNCEVGLSDHTMGCGASIAATALGATLIEKHFTLRRADGGVDSSFSMEPHELLMLRQETVSAWEAIGQVQFGPMADEINSLAFRRSIYISMDMKAGDVFTPNNLRCIRPGFGLSPKYHDTLMGKHVGRDVMIGTPMSWDLLLPE